MSSSSSSSSNTQATTDHRVAGDNGAIGVSAGGNVGVHIVADEAFELGKEALEDMRGLAMGSLLHNGRNAENAIKAGNEALEESLGFVETLNSQAYRANREAVEESLGFAKSINDRAHAGHMTALRLNGETLEEGLAFADRVNEGALKANNRALDLVDRNSRTTANALTAALTATQEAAKTEEGQVSSQIVKIGIPAAALAFVASQVLS